MAGQRVAGHFSNSDNVYPRYAQGADDEYIRTIEYDPARGFFFHFDRTDRVYKDGYYTAASRRGTCILDVERCSWINFDHTTASDMEWYLGSRETRLHYQEMVPLLKRCLALKTREIAEEGDFRALLLNEFGRINPGGRDHLAKLYSLILWWKAKARAFRPLVGDDGHNRKAYQMIIAEFSRQLKDVPLEWAAIARFLPDGSVPLLARRKSGGQRVEVAIAANSYRLFVHRLKLERQGIDWRAVKTKQWEILGRGEMAGLNVIFRDEVRLKDWLVGVPRALYLSDPEIETLKEWLRDQGDVIAAILGVSSGDVLGTQIEADTWRRRDEDKQAPESIYLGVAGVAGWFFAP